MIIVRRHTQPENGGTAAVTPRLSAPFPGRSPHDAIADSPLPRRGFHIRGLRRPRTIGDRGHREFAVSDIDEQFGCGVEYRGVDTQVARPPRDRFSRLSTHRLPTLAQRFPEVAADRTTVLLS